MCPPPLHLILSSTHYWVTSRSIFSRRSIFCAHSGPGFLNTGNYACQVVFHYQEAFISTLFWQGLFSAHLLRKMQMFSPHYFCAYTISVCLNLQLHFSTLRAEPWLTLCLLFSTRWFLGLCNAVEMVPVTEQLLASDPPWTLKRSSAEKLLVTRFHL